MLHTPGFNWRKWSLLGQPRYHHSVHPMVQLIRELDTTSILPFSHPQQKEEGIIFTYSYILPLCSHVTSGKLRSLSLESGFFIYHSTFLYWTLYSWQHFHAHEFMIHHNTALFSFVWPAEIPNVPTAHPLPSCSFGHLFASSAALELVLLHSFLLFPTQQPRSSLKANQVM